MPTVVYNDLGFTVGDRLLLLVGGGEDIVGQYVDFTRVSNEQVAEHGPTLEAARETVRICKERGYLAEYLSGREKEVEDIMFALYDAEEVQRISMEAQSRKDRAKYLAEGREEGREEGRVKAILDGARAVMAQLGYSASEALKLLGVPDDEAALYSAELGA